MKFIWVASICLLLVGAVMLFRSSGSGEGAASGDAADAGDPRTKWASRLRGRSVPHFQTVETPQAEPAPQLPPPQLVPPPVGEPPPPDPKAELRQRASKDGYLFREEGSSVTYVVKGGTKYAVSSPDELRALGYRDDQVEVVAPGSLSFLSSRPAERTLLRERDKPNVYYYENGQKRWISSPDLFYKMGYKITDIKVVPAGGLGGEATAAPVQ